MDKKEKLLVACFAVFAVVALGVGLLALNNFLNLGNPGGEPAGQEAGEMGHLTMTDFDKQMALKLMDRDSDGKCDECGMPVEMCIASGQLECNMGPDGASKMGLLNSEHAHADWKIYVNGKALDWAGKTHGERMQAGLSVSSFIHVDEGAAAPELPGDVLHMHAKNVPLWLFFESLGMKFGKDCLELGDAGKYCNGGGKTLKFFVNGQPNGEFDKYVFKDLDKILISYGDAGEDVRGQLASVTGFAGNH